MTSGDKKNLTSGLIYKLIIVKTPAAMSRFTKSAEISNPAINWPANIRAIKFEKKEKIKRDINLMF